MTRWRLGSLTLFAVLLLPGCFAALDAPASSLPDATTAPERAPRDEGPMNLFLLDAPRPFSASVSSGAEPSILVDRAGEWVWIGDTSGLARSSDGGVTWTKSSNPFSRVCDGWALAQDDVGTLHVANTACATIEYARSSDAGATWAFVHPLVDAAPIADRPWIAARGDGQLGIIYYDFGRSLKETCVGSSDAGLTWPSRTLVNGGSANAGNAVFDAQGRLYYATSEHVWRYASACTGGPAALPLPPSGAQIFTQLALDASGGIYVAQPTPGNGAMTIRAWSSWGGWVQRELTVSPPALRSNTFGTISVHGGEIAVAWYGSEASGNPSNAAFQGAWNVYVARVTGFWGLSPSVRYDRITTEPNYVGWFCMSGITCSSGRTLLDYFGIDHGPDGALHVAYGHDAAGARGVRYARLAP